MNVMRKCGSAMIGPNRYPGQARRISGALVLFPIFAILVGLLVLAAKSERTQAQGSAQALPSVKVAFIADTGITANAVAVLQLIRDQNADFVLHQGDFGYFEGDPAAAPVWDDQLNAVLGADYPYFGSIGNIDVNAWPAYRELLVGRLNRIPDAVCQGDYGVNASCHYKGIFFILSGVGTMGSDHVQFIEDELSKDNSAWRICTWHKVQQAMQLGDKPDEVGWGAYEACREGGAIIATGHEHSYSRTRTLVDFEHQVVDPNHMDPNNVRVVPGSTFAFVSGLGGKSIRNQDRCLPTTFPYGCNGEWASIYTSDQGAKYGALFIEFNFGGDPTRAKGQFINIDGEIIDDFMITTASDNTAPVGDDQQVTTAPNTARAITLTGSDSEGDALTFTVLTGPSNGALGGDAPNLTYTPDANFTGSDSFTFVANDGTADSGPATVSITVSSIQADLAFGPHLDPEDGAAGLGLAITRVIATSTGTGVATAWDEYRARLTYDGTCINILEIRPKEFSVTVNRIDDGAGIAEFQGNALPGAAGPAELAQVVSRTVGSSQIPCVIAVEITDLTDDGGNPIDVVPDRLTRSLLRGDALADDIVNIADALFIAQYLAGLRPECTTEVNPTCLHSLNAANWQHDGGFDQVTIADAGSIAQHLLGLEDGS